MNCTSFLLAVACSGALSSPDVTLDRNRQLFLDDYLIESMHNVDRRVQTAQKFSGNPVLWPTQPWEDKLAVVYGSVIRDGDTFKLWYKSGGGIAYAESGDGITWNRPQLDLVKIDGVKTNVLFRKNSKKGGADAYPYFYELFGVHKDDRTADPAQRYKMGFLNIDWNFKGTDGDPFHPGQRRGLGVATSPDGLHWTLVNNWATEAICDGATHWMFDPAGAKYVLYGRTRKTLPEVEAAWSKYDWYKDWHSGRAVARVESPDFLTWNLTKPASAPVVLTTDLGDAPGTEIYSMKVFPYEGVYIGLVQAFMALPDVSTLDIQLAVSRDSIHFTRVGDSTGQTPPVPGRRPFITLGEVGSWDRFNLSIGNNGPLAVGDELRFYYGGRTYRHTPYKGKDTGPTRGGLGFATIKRDRFVALQASFDGGEIVTRPMIVTGKSLHLNAKANFGEIAIQALSADGKIIAQSRPIQGDALDLPVEWKDAWVPESNIPIKLKISLKNACLFAVWAE